MLWEQLVTDGHVRAARLRSITPMSALIGLLLTAIGIFVLIYYVWSVPLWQVLAFSSNPESALVQKAAAFDTPPAQVFSSESQPNISPDEQQNLSSQKELPLVYKAIGDSLRATDNPPANLAIQTAKKSDDFWSWNWPPNKIFYLNKGDLRAFGAVVMSNPPPAPPAPPSDNFFSQFNPGPQPVRWLAIFRKTPTGWDDVAIKGNGFVAPPGEKTAKPSDLTLSLRTLMSMPAARP